MAQELTILFTLLDCLPCFEKRATHRGAREQQKRPLYFQLQHAYKSEASPTFELFIRLYRHQNAEYIRLFSALAFRPFGFPVLNLISLSSKLRQFLFQEKSLVEIN